MEVFLETERLVLHRFTESGADDLVALDGDPAVMRWLTGGAPTPRDAIERDILPRFLADYERFDGLGSWAAIERATGEFLGWVSLRPRDDARPDEVSLGYRLRRVAWGRGYATEAARADPQGFHGAGRSARGRHDVRAQPRLPARDGEGWADAGTNVPPEP